ncbi:Uncharacterised protein [Mycobacterium tuberculosis]|uniref:Uncharacterized protein n=1 Tax=Mycobacterium tuberculosis TaxID=1773 RepID=A0A0U0QTB4_MYCTX|nr:Uncharacterised protein [Mycobacterium tuberculosis]
MHHVGAADPELVDGTEMEDPRVLEEAAENRAHDDVFRNALRTWTQRADAAYHHLDPHTGSRRAVQRIDDLLINKGIHLESDAAFAVVGTLCTVRRDLPLDAVNDAGADSVRGHQQVAVGQLA